MSWRPRVLPVIAASLVATLAWSAVASAEDYQRQITPAGRAAARAVVLTKTDFGTATGWTGGLVKPDDSPDTNCPNFQPKLRDLVLVGEAAADWSHAGAHLHSESGVLKTVRMAQLDWQRSTARGELACARSYFRKHSTASTRFISIQPLAFPRITSRTQAFRILFDVTGASREIIRMASDVVSMGRGRTEVTLLTTVRLDSAATIAPIEAAIATRLVSRARV